MLTSWLPALLCNVALLAQQQKPAAELKFESNTNLVLVPVIVRDRHGHIVKNLVRDDFQVFDKGQPQLISGFTVQVRGLAGATSRLMDGQSSKEVPKPQPSVQMPLRFIVFLFDDLHLDPGELAQVREAAERMLSQSLQPADAAAVISTSGQTNTGFTQDLGKLTDAIRKIRLQTLYAHKHGCPDVTHYQADLIVNMNDADALKEAIDDARHCSPGDELHLGSATPHLRVVAADADGATMLAWAAAKTELAVGEQGVRVSERMILQLVAKLGTMPGQHSLIFVSSGFFVGTSEARSEEEQILDRAAQASVMISGLDARGLYTYMIDSSQRYISLDKEKYNSQSLKANDNVMSELAAGTGGTYFHNSNDLAGGFKSLTAAPECLYLLEFSPKNVKQDGSYHQLKVKVNLSGAKLQVRHGYFSEKPPKKTSSVANW